MDKKVSIVLSSEVKNYRKLAQLWYGLTDEQMVGLDVHHNPPRSLGGRNIPEHLFVYHCTLHSAIHGNDFTRWAREGGKIGNKVANEIIHSHKDEFGRSKHALKMAEKSHAKRDEFGRSVQGVINGERINAEKNEFGKSVNAVKAGTKGGPVSAKKLHEEKDELGRSKHGVKSAKKLHKEKDEFGRSLATMRVNAQRWEDPNHPELGQTTAGALAMKQKFLGFPHGKENRRRVL